MTGSPARPLRVVRIITRMNIGGPTLHAVALTTRMDPERFATCLVAGTPEASEGDWSHLVPDGARLIRIPSLVRPLRPLADLRTLARVLALLWREQPDVIHTHLAKAGAIGRVAGWLYNRIGPGLRRSRRALILHTFHGHVLDGYFSARRERVFVGIERWLARRTDGLIAVSEAIRDELLAKGIGRPEQWRVIRLGLNLARLSDMPPADGGAPVRVGMVGRLVPIKNHGLFLEAMQRLTGGAAGPAVRGIIIGDGELRPQLEARARQLGVQEAVTFAGWQTDVRAVYEGLEAACLTSWNEGTPVSLIEAMAAGRAVVATDVGGVRDLLAGPLTSRDPIPPGGYKVAERGLMVRAGDADGLTAALQALARDPALRQRLGASGREFVTQRFTEGRLVADITRLYEEMIAARRPRSA